MNAPTSLSYAGALGFQQQPSLPAYSPSLGGTQEDRWRGPSGELNNFMGQMATTGATARCISNDGALAEVSVSWPRWQDGNPANNTALLTPQWGLKGNDLSKDIFTHDGFVALNSTQRNYLREVRNGDDTHRGDIDPTGPPADFLNAILRKEESFTLSQWVLHLSTTLAATWTGPISVLNVGSVYETTAGMRSAEGVPGNLPFPIPAGQWLKRTPTYSPKSDGKWDYTQEWWWANSWDATLYPNRA